MNKIGFAVVIGSSLLAVCSFSFAEPEQPRLWAISATSQGPTSAAPACVIAEKCQGFWTPGMRDHGSGEGLYLQFEKTTALGAVEVVSDSPVMLSINGQPLPVQSATVVPGARKSSYFRLGVGQGYEVKSIFVRIAPPNQTTQQDLTPAKIFALRLYAPFPDATASPPPQKSRLIPLAPIVVPAKVSASSVLDPAVAYQPANLFDSRNDFAWSTNGKQTSGSGEWAEVRFSAPVNIRGVVVWNGYQRSESHYRANGRPSQLTLTDSRGRSRALDLKDKMEPQRIDLPKPFVATTSLRFTIDKFYRGAKYPDVLISEMRFVDDKNNILLPVVALTTPPASSSLSGSLDRSFKSAICAQPGDAHKFQYDLKIRANGSFAAYRKSDDPGEKSESVWEGNWEEQDGALRLFGKRYSSSANWKQVSYGLPEQASSLEIFQTNVKVRQFKDLEAADLERDISLALKARVMPTAVAKRIATYHAGVLQAQDASSLTKVLAKSLADRGGIMVESPLFSDIFVPTDSGACP